MDFNFNPFQGSLFTGSGTPWGASDSKGALYNALTTGAGTPWGAPDQKGVSGFNDPIASYISNNGPAGNTTQGVDRALFSGEGTPWADPNKKSMAAFQDPITRTALGAMGKDSGVNSYLGSLNSGAYDMLGMGAPAPAAPNKPTLQTDPSQFKAADYGDYNKAGQDQINMGLAKNRNSLAASLQKTGGLRSADYGAGLGEAQYGADQERGGLANAIANMQRQGQYAQLNAANQNSIDQYNNDYQNYQNALNTKNANRKTAQDFFTTTNAAYFGL